MQEKPVITLCGCLICFASLLTALGVGAVFARTASSLLKLRILGYHIEVEVAVTNEDRDRGLMYRHSLPPGYG